MTHRAVVAGHRPAQAFFFFAPPGGASPGGAAGPGRPRRRRRGPRAAAAAEDEGGEAPPAPRGEPAGPMQGPVQGPARPPPAPSPVEAFEQPSVLEGIERGPRRAGLRAEEAEGRSDFAAALEQGGFAGVVGQLLEAAKEGIPEEARRGDLFADLAELDAAGHLARGRARFADGDRGGALRDFEACLGAAPGLEERVDALYGATSCHASFGDYESCQITLREAIVLGLDFEEALRDPARVRWTSSAQLKQQLGRYAASVKRKKEKGEFAQELADRQAQAEAARRAAAGGAAGGEGPAKKVLTRTMFVDMYSESESQLQEVLEGDDDLDMSILGIAKRVGTLVGVGVAAFALLWVAGYFYYFNGRI